MIVSSSRILGSSCQHTDDYIRVHVVRPCLLDRRDRTVREGSDMGCWHTRVRPLRSRSLPFSSAWMGRGRSHVQCDHVLLQAFHPAALPSSFSHRQLRKALVACHRIHNRILDWRCFCFIVPMQPSDLCLVFDCQGRLLHQYREVLHR